MADRPSVVVTGSDEPSVAETASVLQQVADSFTVSTSSTPGEESAEAYCLVADGTEATVVERIREEQPTVPVVLFADGDEAAVEAVLADGATDYVQRAGSERYAVLAHRIERMLEDGGGTSEVGSGEDGADADDSAWTQRREMITQLQAVSRDLMQAPSRESIASVVTRAIATVLDYDMSVVRLYDPDRGALEPVASSENALGRMGERPEYSLDEGLPGQVFASGESAVYGDVRAIDDTSTAARFGRRCTSRSASTAR